MPKKNIIIIGGGFAGISAVIEFIRCRPEWQKGYELILIDKKKTSDFLPVLPDIIGRGVNYNDLQYSIEAFSIKSGFQFIQETVRNVDLQNKKVMLSALEITYEYLIIASGSETNFYGNDKITGIACKLDDVLDGKKLFDLLKKNTYQNYVVCGGGYTGIETAVNLKRLLSYDGINADISIVEMASDILGPLPGWMKDYVTDNINKSGIKVHRGVSVKDIEENRIRISDGTVFENAVLIWAAGVKTSDYVMNLNVNKTRQGRVEVDKYLRINKNCFAAGDCANFVYEEKPLRMAVQFSIVEGRTAAHNIMRSIRGKKLKNYKPVDLGYIIPMANNRSCGIVMGIKVKGALATFMHYAMCVYRLWG